MTSLAPAYTLRFTAPTRRDQRDTLARVEVVFGPDMGALYGVKLTGIIIKNGAKSPFAPPEPYVYFPARHNQAAQGRAYIEPEPTEAGKSVRLLTETLLATYRAWYEEMLAHENAARRDA